MKRICLVITSVIAVLAVLQAGASPPETQSLAGEWRFALDRSDAGIQEKWFERVLPDRLRLPGSVFRTSSTSAPSPPESINSRSASTTGC